MAAAQLMGAARRDVPGIDAALARGELAPLVDWLRSHVHAHGSRYGFADLVAIAAGEPFGFDRFEQHLRARYLNAPPA